MKNILTTLLIIALCATTALADFTAFTLVNQDPDPAFAGNLVDIRVSIENPGSVPVENFVLELIPDYPFEAVSGEDLAKSAGTLRAYQIGNDAKILKYRIRVSRDVPRGTYDVTLRGYSAGQRDTQYLERTLKINIDNKESAEVIYIDQVELTPGKITPMTFTINNVGSAPLSDITFQWENEDGIILPVGSSDKKYIKYLDIDQSAELVYNVIASSSANPDLYKLKLILLYDDKGEEKEITATAGVYVGGSTDFDVAFSGSANGETSFSVANIGSVPASSVTVSIPEQARWRVTGSTSSIIGNLNKGDYTITSFAIQQAGGLNGQQAEQNQQRAPTSSIVLVELAYTDTRGERHNLLKEVQVNPTALKTTTTGTGASQFGARTETTSNTTWIIAGLLIIALAYAGYRYRHTIQRLLKRKK